MRNWLISALILLVLLPSAWWLGRSSTPATDPDLLEKAERFDQLQLELGQWKDKDFRLWMETEDFKTRYMKTDVVMEKLFLVLMAQLGLKMTKKQKKWLNPASRKVPLPPSAPPAKKPLSAIATPAPQATSEPYQTVSNSLPDDVPRPSLKDPMGLEARVQKNKWYGFNKYLKKDVRRLVDGDVWRDLWRDDQFKGELRDLEPEQLKAFVGRYNGRYRDRHKEEDGLSFRFEEIKPKGATRRIRLTLSSRLGLAVRDSFDAKHPFSHNSGGGTCRGLVLRSKRNLEILLLRLGRNNGLLGRVYHRPSKKSPTLIGTFLLAPKGKPFKQLKWHRGGSSNY